MGWTAIVNHDLKEVGVTGDTPWDIMGSAVEEISQAYLKHWKRLPTYLELLSALDFVINEENCTDIPS